MEHIPLTVSKMETVVNLGFRGAVVYHYNLN